MAAHERTQGFLWRFAPGPHLVRHLMNFWGPFRGAGIRVREIAPDWRRVRVELRMRFSNRNYVGTHFGGSLFAMADPFYMLMMMHNLGRDYVVWDKAGSVRFLKPGRGTVTADFELTDAMLEDVRAKATPGVKYEPTYSVEVKDAAGTVIASVEKTLHIRRKTS
jgi:acyl-coenzyme A thioesterase PaaI-like protein